MSDIVKASSDDFFSKLAAKFGIDVSKEEYSSGSNTKWTYPTTIQSESLRILKSTWQSGTAFQWNYPGHEYVEDYEEAFPAIHELGGFIVSSEIQPVLAIETLGEERATRTLCSLTGYRKGQEFIKAIPDRVYFSSMYDGWDNATNSPTYTKPKPGVEQMGFLGARGKSCHQCILSGESIHRNENGEVIGECQFRGRLFFYVTDFYRTKRGKPIAGSEAPIEVIKKSVKEVTGEDGLLLLISLPNKLGLKGNYDPKDPTRNRQGYLSYLQYLRKEYGKSDYNRVSPLFNYTKISIQPPIDGGKNTKNFLIFQEVKTFDYDKLEKALEVWENVHPRQEPEILNPDDWTLRGSNERVVIDASYTPVSEVQPIVTKSTTPAARPLSIVKVEELPEDDIPF